MLQNVANYGSELNKYENRPSLLAMVVYSYKENVKLDDWMKQYAKTNDTYFADQKKNFLHMRNNLEQYLKKCA